VLSPAAHLKLSAENAFETYIQKVEARLARQRSSWDSELSGNIRIEPVNGGTWEVNGGLLHHWRGVALVPDANAKEMLALLRDYNRLSQYYAPQVVSSRTLANNGKRATLAMRFKKLQVITVVLDAEFETESGLDGNSRGYSFSRSTHIWQIDQAGTAQERRREEGMDDGFLWRLNSYWSFAESRDGLLMEFEAVSLTRDAPGGLGWLIAPIVKTLPRASLEFTLTATKNALAANGGSSQRREGTEKTMAKTSPSTEDSEATEKSSHRPGRTHRVDGSSEAQP
jgi:hypothetical protein